MTITTNPSRDEYTSTAGQTVFNYTFKIYANTDLNVYVTPSGQYPDDSTDLTTDYVVDPGTIGDEAGGFITFNSPLNAGDAVTIVSAIPYDRTVDYQNNGDFLPTTVNNDNDRQVSQIKQILEQTGRTLQFQESLQGASTLSLPDPVSQQFMRWKTDLTGLENVDLVDGALVVAEGQLLIFPTVAAMETSVSAALVSGVNILTQGYKTPGDGGHGSYLVVPNGTGTEDGGLYINLSSGLQAQLIYSDSVNALQFGAAGDDITDDTTACQNAINTALKVVFPKGYTFNVTKLDAVSNCHLVVDGTIKMNNANITDSDTYLFGNRGTSALENITIEGKGSFVGPDDVARRASGILLAVNNTCDNVKIGAGLTFRQFLAGINPQECTNVTIGTCYYDNMRGTNAGIATESGACISLTGCQGVVIDGIQGTNIHKSAFQTTASGFNQDIPTDISVGSINIQGAPGSTLIPEAVGIRAAKNLTIGEVVGDDLYYGVILTAESTQESFQDIAIGSVAIRNTSNEAVLIRDIRASKPVPCKRVTIGSITADDVGTIALRVQTVNDVSVHSVTANNVGSVSQSPAVSGSDLFNLQVGSLNVEGCTGQGINLLRCANAHFDDVYLNNVATVGGISAVLWSGNANDSFDGVIKRLQVRGGAYDYCLTANQPASAELTLDSFSGDVGTSGWFTGNSLIFGGKSLSSNFDSSGNNMPFGSTQRDAVIKDAYLVVDTTIPADGANYETFQVRDLGNNIICSVDSSATTLTQFTNIPLTVNIPDLPGVFTSLRAVRFSTGTPVSYNSFSIQVNYYDKR